MAISALAALAFGLVPVAPSACALREPQASTTALNQTPLADKARAGSAPAFAVAGKIGPDGADESLRLELLRCYLRGQGKPFLAGALDSSTTAADQGSTTAGHGEVSTALYAAFLVCPSLLEDRSVRLKLGPWLIRPGEPNPRAWWTTHVEFSAVEVAEATTRLGDDPDSSAASEHGTSDLRGLLGHAQPLAALGEFHAASVAGLLKCSGITGEAGGPAITAASVPASLQPTAQHPFVPYLGTSSALELVAWIQALDAKQCALRAEGVDRLKDADAIVADIRAVLRALEAHRLRRLLEERVPPSAPSGASLCASPSWPNDAWELVAAVERGRKNAARIRSELLRLAAAVAAEQRLPPEVLARLEERLEVIAAKLPLNLQWNQRLAEEIRERVGEVMDPSGGAQSARTQLALAGNADGALNIGGAVIDGMTGPDDIVGGRMAANRAAWDVYGYLWSGKDALLPSEHAQRESQREAALSEFNAVAAQHGTPPAVAKMLANDLADSLSDPWRPWMQFPVSNEALKERVLPSIRESVAWSLDALRSNEFKVTGEWKVLFWWGVADSSFALEPNSNMVRHRNQPFADCRPYYINGAGLASRR